MVSLTSISANDNINSNNNIGAVSLAISNNKVHETEGSNTNQNSSYVYETPPTYSSCNIPNHIPSPSAANDNNKVQVSVEIEDSNFSSTYTNSNKVNRPHTTVTRKRRHVRGRHILHNTPNSTSARYYPKGLGGSAVSILDKMVHTEPACHGSGIISSGVALVANVLRKRKSDNNSISDSSYLGLSNSRRKRHKGNKRQTEGRPNSCISGMQLSYVNRMKEVEEEYTEKEEEEEDIEFGNDDGEMEDGTMETIPLSSISLRTPIHLFPDSVVDGVNKMARTSDGNIYLHWEGSSFSKEQVFVVFQGSYLSAAEILVATARAGEEGMKVFPNSLIKLQRLVKKNEIGTSDSRASSIHGYSDSNLDLTATFLAFKQCSREWMNPKVGGAVTDEDEESINSTISSDIQQQQQETYEIEESPSPLDTNEYHCYPFTANIIDGWPNQFQFGYNDRGVLHISRSASIKPFDRRMLESLKGIVKQTGERMLVIVENANLFLDPSSPFFDIIPRNFDKDAIASWQFMESLYVFKGCGYYIKLVLLPIF